MWEKPRRCWQKIPRCNMKPKIEEQTMDKRTNNDLHNATHKTKDWEQHEYHKKRGWTQLSWKGYQFQLHYWHPSCYFCYRACDKPHDLGLLLQGYVESTREESD